MKIELLWFEGCPNYLNTLETLKKILQEQGIDEKVDMIQIHDDAEAVTKKFLGSPTIRINGTDPFAQPHQNYFAMQCRIYCTPEGLKGIPTNEMLRDAVLTLTLKG